MRDRDQGIHDQGSGISDCRRAPPFCGAQRLPADIAQYRPYLRRRPRLRRRSSYGATPVRRRTSIAWPRRPALHRRALLRGDLHAVALRAADRRVCVAQARHRCSAGQCGADHRARPDHAAVVAAQRRLLHRRRRQVASRTRAKGGPDWNGEITPRRTTSASTIPSSWPRPAIACPSTWRTAAWSGSIRRIRSR